MIRPGWAAVLGIAVACASAPTAVGQEAPVRDSIIFEAPNGPWSLRNGERVRAMTVDGRSVEGSVLAQSDSVLMIGKRFLYVPLGASSRVRYDDLARLEAFRPPRWRERAMLTGGAVGLGVGALLGARSVHNECSGGDNTIGPCFDRGSAAFAGGLLGLALGSVTARMLTPARWQLLSVRRTVPRGPLLRDPRSTLTPSLDR